jgi:CRP-like cAMP-binding protein
MTFGKSAAIVPRTDLAAIRFREGDYKFDFIVGLGSLEVAMIFYDLFRNGPVFHELGSGQTLFQEGSEGEDMYVLIEGQALIELQGLLFEEIGPGDFVGELAVIDGSPRLATVITQTACKFVRVDRQRFRTLIAENHRFALEVMTVMARRLRKAHELRFLDTANL